MERLELGLEIGAREGVETLLALRHELTMSTCGHTVRHTACTRHADGPLQSTFYCLHDDVGLLGQSKYSHASIG